MSDDFELWVSEQQKDWAGIFREYRKAHGWTQTEAAATFCVHPATIKNWEKLGRFGPDIYRQIFESDWGQAKFNPLWPDFFVRCGLGYEDFEPDHDKPIYRGKHVNH